MVASRNGQLLKMTIAMIMMAVTLSFGGCGESSKSHGDNPGEHQSGAAKSVPVSGSVAQSMAEFRPAVGKVYHYKSVLREDSKEQTFSVTSKVYVPRELSAGEIEQFGLPPETLIVPWEGESSGRRLLRYELVSPNRWQMIANVPNLDEKPISAADKSDLLVGPLRAGTRWSHRSRPSSSGKQGMLVNYDYAVESIDETVTVPAGTFRDCVKIRRTANQSLDVGGSRVKVVSDSSEWFSKGVCSVKCTVSESITEGTQKTEYAFTSELEQIESPSVGSSYVGHWTSPQGTLSIIDGGNGQYVFEVPDSSEFSKKGKYAAEYRDGKMQVSHPDHREVSYMAKSDTLLFGGAQFIRDVYWYLDRNKEDILSLCPLSDDKSKVTRAVMDMRRMATGIEAYYIDNNAYPSWEKRAGGAGEPAFVGCVLTTPVGYVVSYPLDPFGLKPDQSYAYYSKISGGKEGWVLFSPGPDQKYDLKWELYDPAASQPSAELIQFQFDPTNGAASSGDIMRVKQ